ncbi:MAG: hypothetical protein LBP20_02550 [Treponema sp.]|jgi:hypothetical protein|nr:hypothetical protein [Treponema sp.]
MEFITAINFAPFPKRGVLGSQDARRSLETLRDETGAGHIILTPPGIQDTPQSEDITFAGEDGPEDGELQGFIAFAQSLGLKVILKPTVNCKNGVWRAFISFFDHETPGEPKWSRWFAAHERFQRHYARIAEETGCVMFIAGCEMVMAERKEGHWRDLIAQVKRVFSGPVSYNTDKYQEDALTWWDCVDVISSSGYYPAGAWETQLDRIEGVVKKYGKPFFFAEAGCMSAAGSPALPNKWDLPGARDTAGQAAWYREMFEHCGKRPWVEGFGLWSWPGRLPSAEDAARDRDYSLYGKPACRVVHAAFTSGPQDRPL